MADTSRIREGDLVIPALRQAASRPNGFVTTSDLIAELTELFQPTGEDAEILAGRTDSRFTQKVRNLVSHKKNDTNFIFNGFAEHDEDQRGIRITAKGHTLLKQVGG